MNKSILDVISESERGLRDCGAIDSSIKWISVKDWLPKNGVNVIALTSEGVDIGSWGPEVMDEPDSMGHDSGFTGYLMFPSRSFGNPEYFSPPVNQPSHWMPIPDAPEESE